MVIMIQNDIYAQLFPDETFFPIGIDEHIFIELHLLMPLISITIVSKILVPSMGKSRLVCGFQRTPETLSTSANLDCIGKYTIHIATVETIDLFEEIEIVEKSSIVEDIVGAFDSRDRVEWESDVLIDGEGDVEDSDREEHPVDKWYREDISYMPPIFRNDIGIERSLFGLILFSKYFEKDDSLSLEIESILRSETIIFSAQFMIQCFDLGEDIADSVSHRG